MRDFNKDIKIDEYNLIEELIRQPQLYYEWSTQASNAYVDMIIAKDKVEVVKSEIEIRIRKNPSLYDLADRPTEATIKSKILTNRKVKKAVKEYHEALRIERILNKAERAFDHRKKSLEGLVFTTNRIYYSDPKTDMRTRQTVDQSDLLNQSRNKRRRIKRRE